MSRRKDKGRLAPFVPLDKEMMNCPAWRATSYGARWLYVHLKQQWSFKRKNNSYIHLSQRDAQDEMGCKHRDSISRWFRELEYYGFIVMTEPGSLGVDGKGKAPHWRLTEIEAPGGRNGNTLMLPTKDYLKWNGVRFQDQQGAIKRTREWRRRRVKATTPIITEVVTPDPKSTDLDDQQVIRLQAALEGRRR